MIYRQGTRVAIVGSPNVGKSSLMNRLLREDRTIVTAIAGTTRDTVSETINIGGVPVILTDTAGLETSEDPVERLGIARSQAAIEQSDALLVVLEHGRPLRSQEERLLAETAGRPRLVVVNKCDLGDDTPFNVSRNGSVSVSALTGGGLETLESRLRELVSHGQAPSSEAPVVTNARHKAALNRALESLTQAQTAIQSGLPEDLASSDLRAAVESIGEITGETVTEDLLNSIFRNFCIGK
jgi:tRNA modification GTPase